MIGNIYFITDGQNIKIGYTKNSVEKRLKQLNTGNESKLYILGYMNGSQEDEKYLHKKFGFYRIRHDGEWFYPNQEIIDYINDNSLKPHSYVMIDEDSSQVMIYQTT